MQLSVVRLCVRLSRSAGLLLWARNREISIDGAL